MGGGATRRNASRNQRITTTSAVGRVPQSWVWLSVVFVYLSFAVLFGRNSICSRLWFGKCRKTYFYINSGGFGSDDVFIGRVAVGGVGRFSGGSALHLCPVPIYQFFCARIYRRVVGPSFFSAPVLVI